MPSNRPIFTAQQFVIDRRVFVATHGDVCTRSLRSAVFVCLGYDPTLADGWKHYTDCAWCKDRYLQVKNETRSYKPGPLPAY